MTNAEAIETLRANYPDACYEQLREAVDVAIDALKAQGTAGDTISRQAAIEALSTSRGIIYPIRAIEALPSTQSERKTGNGGDNSNKMDTIKIKRNTLGDTRTATYVPTYKEFRDSNRMHIDDVKNMMSALSGEIRSAGIRHDYTKISDEGSSLFYRELCATIEGKMNFTKGEWYPMHVRTERHHLNEYCPDNVNLIDVLEMICDCVCAEMARSGEVRPVEILPEILQKAVENTVKLCKEHVEVIEHE